MAKIKIMLADDHTLFRQAIRMLLAIEPEIEVVGEVSNGGDAIEKAEGLRPDVILMDIGMPGLSSFEASRQIKKNRPETKVLFLTMYDDEDYLVEAMDAGASGYVLKDSPAGQLVSAVRDVCRGGSYLSPRMLSQLVDDFRSRNKLSNRLPRFAMLTAREREVLKILAEGNSVKEIAYQLNLSAKTVEAHKFNLMRKLDIHNTVQLVQYAIQKRIIKIADPECAPAGIHPHAGYADPLHSEVSESGSTVERLIAAKSGRQQPSRQPSRQQRGYAEATVI